LKSSPSPLFMFVNLPWLFTERLNKHKSLWVNSIY
jgi:hypothetical protein